MEITDKKIFDKQFPQGTEVLYFPNYDSTPILTGRIVGECVETPDGLVAPVDLIGMGQQFVKVMCIETCSQEQFDEIIKILDCVK